MIGGIASEMKYRIHIVFYAIVIIGLFVIPFIYITNIIYYIKFILLKNKHEINSTIKLIWIVPNITLNEFGLIYNKNYYDNSGRYTGCDTNLSYNTYTKDIYNYIKNIKSNSDGFYLLCEIILPSDNIYLINNIYRNYDNYIIKEVYTEVII